MIVLTGTDGKPRKILEFLSPSTLTGTQSGPGISTIVVPQYPQNWSGVPAITTPTLDRITQGAAEISWRPPGPPSIHSRLSYRIDVRALELDTAGVVQVVWVPVKTVEFTPKSDRIQARITGIPEDIGVSLRVTSISPKGYESLPSGTLQFFMPAKPVIFTIQRVLLAFFGFVAVVAFWVRKKMSVILRGE